VVYSYNPSYSGSRDRNKKFEVIAKSQWDLISKTSQVWWHMSVISATSEMKVEGSRSRACLSESMRPYLKNKLKAKNTGSMTEVLKCLPSRCEVLSSIPSTAKKKRKERKKKWFSVFTWYFFMLTTSLAQEENHNKASYSWSSVLTKVIRCL
jgi:hypothetical protein